VRLPGTKPIDFQLSVIEGNRDVFVEILSIHLDSDGVENDPEIMKKFLLGRITDKIKDKRINAEKFPNLYLLTVLWGNKDAIKLYSEFFKNNPLDLKNVTEPISYLTYSDCNGYYEHYFKTISNLFTEN
jgi:hypothetical protein